jgi:hypothetical protein
MDRGAGDAWFPQKASYLGHYHTEVSPTDRKSTVKVIKQTARTIACTGLLSGMGEIQPNVLAGKSARKFASFRFLVCAHKRGIR